MFKKNKKMITDFFVSIGAGVNQIPLIHEAKKSGFQVIGVDMNSSAPGFYHCDLKVQESIEDYENIYIKLRELLIDGKISAVMTKSYGQAIVTTAHLCEKFGLPFLPYEESKKFLNKKIIKKVLETSGILTPESISFSNRIKTGNIKTSLLPVIARPQTGHAKTDVYLINTPSDLEKFSKNHSSQDFLFEKFIQGEEIICAGIIHEKKYTNILITDKKTTPLPYFVDILHTCPSKHQSLATEITQIGQNIAELFNIQTSPLIMEFIIDESRNLYLLEAVPEFGGEFIPDIMIPAATGYNHIANTINALSRPSFRPSFKRNIPAATAVRYIISDDGILSSYSTDRLKQMEGVIFSKIFKDIGSRIISPRTNHDRIGVIVTGGRTVEQAVATAEAAEKAMNIRIKKSTDEPDEKE